MLSEQQILNFEKDGYIHLKKFFNEAEVKNFSKAIEKKKLMIKEEEIDRSVDINELWEFINHEKMLKVIRNLLGDKIFYMHDAGILASSTNITSTTWHRDNPCRKTGIGPDWNSNEKYNVVSSAVYLTDSNSTLNVIKKSHLKKYKYSISNMLRVIQLQLRKVKKFLFLKNFIESLIGEHVKYGAGDLVIFYTTLYHTGFVLDAENSYREGIIARYSGEGNHGKNFLNYEMNYRDGLQKYKISKKKDAFFAMLKNNNIFLSPEIEKNEIEGVFIPRDKTNDSVYNIKM
tara:strand:+ start:422 stop:1285 length:864 start_codon:yes stop_codon:yes gene_type:complete